MTKLTGMQKVAMHDLAQYAPGEWVSFGYGFGKWRVALRALHHRARELVMYEARDGGEFFCITGEGRAAMTSQNSGEKS